MEGFKNLSGEIEEKCVNQFVDTFDKINRILKSMQVILSGLCSLLNLEL